jgi:hypothetical protein
LALILIIISLGGGQCPGIMLRNVFCEQIAAGGMSTVIDESTCTGDKPEAQKACSEDDDDSDSMSAPKVSRIAGSEFKKKLLASRLKSFATQGFVS